MACLHDPIPQRGFETRSLLREQIFVVRKPDPANAIDGSIPIADLLSMPLVLPSGMNGVVKFPGGEDKLQHASLQDHLA